MRDRHYPRELTRGGVACLEAYVVFAKCWLAKHRVAPDADYVGFDAAAPWPIAGATFDLVMCHGAFFFLPEQEAVVTRLRDAMTDGGALAVSRFHNSGLYMGATAPAKASCDWAAIFPDAAVYDESDLLAALMAQARPEPCGWTGNEAIEAWSIMDGGGVGRTITCGLAMLALGAKLRPNPLIGSHTASFGRLTATSPVSAGILLSPT